MYWMTEPLSTIPAQELMEYPAHADDMQANLIKIRQIRFTIYAKGSELNPAGQPYKINMSSTFSTRNLGYDAN